MKAEVECDLVIVGAGLVGCSVALALQQQGLRIVLLEKHIARASADEGVSFRPLSLSHASVTIFKTLGIWEELSKDASPIRAVQVSEEGVFGSIYFQADDYGVEALGQVLPLHVVQKCLFQAVSAQAGVMIMPIQAIQSITTSLEISLEIIDEHGDLQVIRAGLVVGCDGTASQVRHMLNLDVKQKQGNDVVLTAILDLAEAHRHVAFERFSQEGILALLPLLSGTLGAGPVCGLAWTMPVQQAERLKTVSEKQLRDQITEHFRYRIPAITKSRQANFVPVTTLVTPRSCMPGLVLLGNAAHTLYPLAAQGFNLGLRDVAALAEVLVDAHRAQQPMGDLSVLERYQAWRLPDQKKVMRLTDCIHRATTLKAATRAARYVRGVGLLITDVAPPIKRRVAELTMGLAGKLPKLVRGIALW